MFRSPGDCSVLVQNLRLHLVGNGFIRSAFLETHYCTYGYVYCGSPVRNNGGNRDVSRPGRLCYISAKSASAPCRERIYPFRFFNSALALLLYFFAVARLETLAETILFRIPGDCAILVQNLHLHLVGNGFIRSAFQRRFPRILRLRRTRSRINTSSRNTAIEQTMTVASFCSRLNSCGRTVCGSGSSNRASP